MHFQLIEKRPLRMIKITLSWSSSLESRHFPNWLRLHLHYCEKLEGRVKIEKAVSL